MCSRVEGMEKAGPDGTGLFVVLGCCAEGRVVSSGSSLRFGPDMTKASPMDWLFARTDDACLSIADFGTCLQACGSTPMGAWCSYARSE